MSTLTAEQRRAHHDYAILAEIKREMRQRLHEMMMEVRKKAGDLKMVDDNQFVTDMVMEFDPLNENSGIQDLFADGFYGAIQELEEWEGFDPYSHAGELPSGAVASVEQ